MFLHLHWSSPGVTYVGTESDMEWMANFIQVHGELVGGDTTTDVYVLGDVTFWLGPDDIRAHRGCQDVRFIAYPF